MKRIEPVKTKLRVCHYAQIPCKPFIVEVANEYEAKLIDDALTNQHLFLYDQNIIPDYSNAISVQMFNEEDKEWEDYFNETDFLEWDEFKEKYLNDCKSHGDYLKMVVGF